MDKMKEANRSFDPLEMLTVQQVAELLQVSQPTVREYMKRGELPSVLIGRYRRIRRVDVEAFIERRLTCDYRPMDNRHKQEGQDVSNEDDYPPDPTSQDGAEGNIPF